MPTLQEQIDARKKEAEDKRIHDKLHTVAVHLGRDRSNGERRKRSFAFENDSLSIGVFSGVIQKSESEESYSGSYIKYLGKTVFETDRARITSFIPGDWEKEFEQLHSQAEAVRQTRLADQKKPVVSARDREEAKKWGIEL